MLYLQRYLTNFQKLFFAERRGRWLLSLKISSAQTFWFSNSNVTTFPTSRKCKNFNFSLYTVPAEMLYLQKYLTNFQKLFFSLKEEEGGYSALGISSSQTFWFSNGNVTTFPTSRKCKNFNFSLYTVPAEMLYLQRYLTNFQKHFFGWKKRKVAILRWKFQVHRHFGFPIATLQLFQHPENVKISIFPLHCPGRNAISPEVFNEFSKTFFSLKEEEGGYCRWKFQVHRHFRFPMATLQLFRHPENVKISIFSFYTVPAEMPYVQRYLTNFQKLFLAERRGRWLLRWEFQVHRKWQRYNFSNIPKM